jgi:hypothetical protein
MGEVEQELLYDRLVSGDRPSILALGVTGAAAIKRVRMALVLSRSFNHRAYLTRTLTLSMRTLPSTC